MRRIALVVPNLRKEGGVNQVARFLLRGLERVPGYEPALFSVATAADDAASVRLRAPRTWLRGVQVEEGEWEGHPYRHVGARLAELEFQRYRPRPALTRALQACDLVQVVAGHPAWALAARGVDRPIALWVATDVRGDRRRRLREERHPAGLWRALMTGVTRRFFEPRALRLPDVVFVANPGMLRYAEGLRGRRPTHLAPPGVDTDLFRPAAAGGGAGRGGEEGASEGGRADHGAAGGGDEPGGGPYLLSVGRLADPRKNVTLLFEAYARLRRRRRSTPRLVLAGRTGPPDAAWRRAEELGIRDAVTFRRDVPAEELAALYRGAELFVLASDEEGLGIVVLEAMASGVPVVSTDCGGPSTTVVEGETGRLTPVGDAEALAHAVDELLDDAETRARMGAAGRERVVERFSEAATLRAFLDAYERLLVAERPPGSDAASRRDREGEDR